MLKPWDIQVGKVPRANIATTSGTKAEEEI